jgi:predicted HNH restriction endonuclease
MNLEADFEKEMLRIYNQTGVETKYWARRFLRSVRKDGGLKTAKRMIQRKAKVQDGIWKLAKLNKLVLSVEYAIIQEKWKPLFSDQERQEAETRLEKAMGLLPGEHHTLIPLFEGKLLQINVNVYERNLVAKKKCIAHYGTQCVVCGFDFEKSFGKAAKGFIHVHHLVPLSEISAKYEVDPIKDLRPVCPNCHAVIHLGGKTRTIAEVMEMLA